MKKIFLLTSVAVLVLGASESRAQTWDCGKIENTVSCTLDENGVFTISGNGEMKDYDKRGGVTVFPDDRPWGSSELLELTGINTVIVGKGITYIGNSALEGFSSLRTLIGAEDVKKIGLDAFWNTRLNNVDIPNVVELGYHSFGKIPTLTTLNMPNVKNAQDVLEFSALYSGGNYNENCRQYVNNVCIRNKETGCLSGYIEKEEHCISAAQGCGAGYRQFDNFCNRVRWTPAEVAKVLRDDNTNVVTITFKL